MLNANNVAQQALRTWLAAEGIAADITEDASQMPGLGSNYKAVIFMSPTRDTLTLHGKQVTVTVNTSVNASIDAPKTNLRQYIRSGGGFVGIHNAFGTEYNWPWYEGLLGNANYYDHGANQNGDGRRRQRRPVDGWRYDEVPAPRRVLQPGAVSHQGQVPHPRRRRHARQSGARFTRDTAISTRTPGASTTTAAARG